MFSLWCVTPVKRLAEKIISEMTYNVLSRTLNSPQLIKFFYITVSVYVMIICKLVQ